MQELQPNQPQATEQLPTLVEAQSTPAASQVEPTQSVQPQIVSTQSLGHVALENFIAGASRALGTIAVYLIFLVLMYFIFSSYILPQIAPYLKIYTGALQSLQSLQQLQSATPILGSSGAGDGVDVFQVQELLKQYQQ